MFVMNATPALLEDLREQEELLIYSNWLGDWEIVYLYTDPRTVEFWEQPISPAPPGAGIGE